MEIISPMSLSSPDMVAYVDEAGEKGFSRNIKLTRDKNIGLMCAIAFPIERLSEMGKAYHGGFIRFCEAAPRGAKIHITDAFLPGNEKWATVANDVRSEFFELLKIQQIPIIYDARRLLIERQAHERAESLLQAGQLARKSTIKIPVQPSTQKIETQLIEGLALKLDELASQIGRNCIDLHFDEIDLELSLHYQEAIKRLRSISKVTHQVKGFNLETKTPVMGSIESSIYAGFDVDIHHIGGFKVVGKNDPLVLVVDMVTNALYHHLGNLAEDAMLNAPSSIQNWILEERVFGTRDDAFEDII